MRGEIKGSPGRSSLGCLWKEVLFGALLDACLNEVVTLCKLRLELALLVATF